MQLTPMITFRGVERTAAVAIREPFDIARRQLQDYLRRRRGTVGLRHARRVHRSSCMAPGAGVVR